MLTEISLGKVLKKIIFENKCLVPCIGGYRTFVMGKDRINENLDNLMQIIKRKKLLQAPPLTEQCNLRCRYCIYSDENESFREFGTRKKNSSFCLVRLFCGDLILHQKERKFLIFWTFFECCG